MKDHAARVVSFSIAALVALPAAMLLAGPALFADGPDDERMVVVTILCFVLGLTGLGVGFLSPSSWSIAPWILAAPTVLLSVILAWDERNMLVTGLLLVAGAIGFSLGGTWLGARLRVGRRPPTDAAQTKTP